MFGIKRETNGTETKIYKTFFGIKIKIIHHYLIIDSDIEIRERILPWDDTFTTIQICMKGKLVGYKKEFIYINPTNKQ